MDLYGWWLPNDPRGSTSHSIREDHLRELGQLHHGRKTAQPSGAEIRTFYELAAAALMHPLLRFTPADFATVAEAIGHAVVTCNYTCYACAVMPDHIRMVIRKHRDLAEAMIDNIQTLSRERLVAGGLRDAGHPTWTRGGWKVFLDHPEEVQRTIAYVEKNPLKAGLSAQNWPWGKPYDGWPLHPGHSPNSPYVRVLRRHGGRFQR